MKVKKSLKIFLVLANLIVVIIWAMFTSADNYVWLSEEKDISSLHSALTSIFFYKTLFWLFVVNLTIFTAVQLKRKKYKIAGTMLLLTIIFYVFAGLYVSKKCAPFYYIVFLNQSVGEGYIEEPIFEAGYYIGSILTAEISNKEMEYRRYAINGLMKLKYKPATETLKQILFDQTEYKVIRADAYEALHNFDTEDAKKILNDFRNEATDSLDKEVIKLGEYFIKSTSD